MELAAHADAELINCFPSFSLPPPPVPKRGWSSLACRRGSHGLGAGALRCRPGCPGRHRGWGAPGPHPWTAPLLWASGWANARPPDRASLPRGTASLAGGQSLPSPGVRESLPRCRATLPGKHSILSLGFRSSLLRGKPRLLLPQSPQSVATPWNTPTPAPDTRYLLTSGPEAAQPPGLQSRY